MNREAKVSYFDNMKAGKYPRLFWKKCRAFFKTTLLKEIQK